MYYTQPNLNYVPKQPYDLIPQIIKEQNENINKRIIEEQRNNVITSLISTRKRWS